MSDVQPGILAPLTRQARHLLFTLVPGGRPEGGLRALAREADGEAVVAGIGEPTALALGRTVPGLRSFPALAGPGFGVPSTQAACWCWLRGEDRGDLVHRTRAVRRALGEAFHLETAIDAFQYADSRDLTGYEDGTENPTGEDARRAAVVAGGGPGLDGGSFVAVQHWVHDLDRFEALAAAERDRVIGRRRSDNEEMDDAPASAHVKRAAQESFTPPAFMLRRSMPWADAGGQGLVFVAFGRSFEAFEAVLTRMVGAEDGIADALFRFTRAVSGSYFWCPPMAAGRLVVSALGL